jgi:IS5 family transposase
MEKTPDVSTLKNNLKLVRAETMELVNGEVLRLAQRQGVEDGRKVRTDCTVEAANVHQPSDSWLLYDVGRVLSRLLHRAKAMASELVFTDHSDRAKRRFRAIQHTGKESERERLYRDLLKVAEKSVGYAVSAVERLGREDGSGGALQDIERKALVEQIGRYGGLGARVIDQSRRRVLYHEQVPASEKVASIFEPHTNIIVKDRRDTYFGHKLCLSTGVSGMVLDLEVLRGNPADSALAVRMMKRQEEIWGRPPRQASFDGGFASVDNLEQIKKMGVKDVVFNKKRGLEISEMAKSSWVFRCLSRFRAGIEGGISFLKRCFGLARCLWKGFESFKAYSWASVISHNLLILARHQLE